MDVFASSAMSPGPIDMAAATQYRVKHQDHARVAPTLPRSGQSFEEDEEDDDYDEATVYFPSFARRVSHSAKVECESGSLSGNELFDLEDDDGEATIKRGRTSSRRRLSADDLEMIWDDDEERAAEFDDEGSDEGDHGEDGFESEDDKDVQGWTPSMGVAAAHSMRRTSDGSSSTTGTSVSTPTSMMSPSLPFARRPSNCVGSPPYAQLKRPGLTVAATPSSSSSSSSSSTPSAGTTRVATTLSPRLAQTQLRRGDVSLHPSLSLQVGSSPRMANSGSSVGSTTKSSNGSTGESSSSSSSCSNGEVVSGISSDPSFSPRSHLSTPPTPGSYGHGVARARKMGNAVTGKSNNDRSHHSVCLRRNPTLPKASGDDERVNAKDTYPVGAFTASELVAVRKRSSTGPPAFFAPSASRESPIALEGSHVKLGQHQLRGRQPTRTSLRVRNASLSSSPTANGPTAWTPSPSRPAKPTTTTIGWREASSVSSHNLLVPVSAADILRQSVKQLP